MRMTSSRIRLVLYSAVNDGETRALSKAVSRFLPPAQISLCKSCDDTAAALRGVLSGYGIILLMIRDRAELVQITGLGERLKDHLVILLLDRSIQELNRQALKLYPRYTGSIQENPHDVLMVLEKMITKIQNKLKGEDDG